MPAAHLLAEIKLTGCPAVAEIHSDWLRRTKHAAKIKIQKKIVTSI